MNQIKARRKRFIDKDVKLLIKFRFMMLKIFGQHIKLENLETYKSLRNSIEVTLNTSALIPKIADEIPVPSER